MKELNCNDLKSCHLFVEKLVDEIKLEAKKQLANPFPQDTSEDFQDLEALVKEEFNARVVNAEAVVASSKRHIV